MIRAKRRLVDKMIKRRLVDKMRAKRRLVDKMIRVEASSSRQNGKGDVV